MSEYTYKCQVCGAPSERAVEIMSDAPPHQLRFIEVCDTHADEVINIALAHGGRRVS